MESDVHIREFEEIFARLAHPFADEKQRKGGGNQTFRYIDQYQVMNRLDDVVGPANWSCEHVESNTGVSCRITLTLPDGRTVSRDGASGFDVRKPGDKQDRSPSMVVKTAYADSFKKAGEAFGIGRYLKGKLPYYYRRVAARHGGGDRADDPEPLQGKTSEPPTGDEFPARMPRSERPGVLLYKLLASAKYGPQKMIHKANEYGARDGFPERIVDWSQDQVEAFCDTYSIPPPQPRRHPGREASAVGAMEDRDTGEDLTKDEEEE